MINVFTAGKEFVSLWFTQRIEISIGESGEVIHFFVEGGKMIASIAARKMYVDTYGTH